MSPSTSTLAHHWTLDPQVDYLNHGSFGACPRAVLEHQAELQAELERQPVEFLARGAEERFDSARQRLAEFVGADPEGLVAVPNATTGVNTVLRSLEFQPGDQLLTTDHEYVACRNALDAVAEAQQAEVEVVPIPFPGASPDEIVERVLAAVTERTRLALIDQVTSPTGLIMPIDKLVEPLDRRGVDLLVDGAHAPGMLDLSLDQLGCAYFTGNCHKWMCTPKGSALLYVRADRRARIRPLVIGHAATTRRPGRSRFHDEFDWVGTNDPTPFLCVPKAIDVMASMVDGGWPEIRRRNRELALEARSMLSAALEIEPPCSEDMIGSLVAVPLPTETLSAGLDPLGTQLIREYGFETLVVGWPALGLRILRVSAQLYNSVDQYRRLSRLLPKLL